MHTSIDAGPAGTGASTGLRRRSPLVASMVAATLLALPGATLAGQPVDPATLNPPPPDSFMRSACSTAATRPAASRAPTRLRSRCPAGSCVTASNCSMTASEPWSASARTTRTATSCAATSARTSRGRSRTRSRAASWATPRATTSSTISRSGDVTSGTDKISGRYFRIDLWRTHDPDRRRDGRGAHCDRRGLHLTPHHPFFSGCTPSALAPTCAAVD